VAIFCVLLIAAVAWAIAALVSSNDSESGVTTAVRPEEILDCRLASGEIDAEAYDALRAKLRAAGSRQGYEGDA
jgi:uncharacterized membrane protein